METEKNIPVPSRSQYGLDKFEVGESAPVHPDKINSVRVTASKTKKSNPGWDFTTRKTETGYRIFRIA